MSMPGRGQGMPGLTETPGQPVRGGDAGVVRRGDPLPGESSALVYPMFVGSRWVVRDSPRYTRLVEGRGRTTVPAGTFEAWNLRGRSEFESPGDVVHFYYAREGLIRVTLHADLDVVDTGNIVVGRVIMDMDQSLTAFTPAGTAN